MLITKTKLKQIGIVIASHQGKRVKLIQEGLGGIRDVILNSSYLIYGKAFQKVDEPLRNAQHMSSFLAQVPRHGIETLALIVFSVVAYSYVTLGNENGVVIPILAATALGVQRIMPALQTAYHSWTFWISGKETLIDVLNLLENEEFSDIISSNNPLSLQFNKLIAIKNVNFSYLKSEPPVIQSLSMEVKKGDRIGIIGGTGCGKSTFIDILIGLLEPDSGTINVDNTKLNRSNLGSWRKKISHVPQNIFLVDGTVKENIAFGVTSSEIDDSRVCWAAKIAQLTSMIEQLPMKYNNSVGEQGSSLSGGQRQRIGIARALYKGGSVLVLDEATSALDGKTETLVMDAIARLGKSITVIIIAHRLTTLKFCNKVFEIENGKILRYGDYNKIIGTSSN